MPVSSLSEPNGFHPISIMGYTLNLGNIATILTSISLISTVSNPFSDSRIQSLSAILVVSIIHSGLQVLVYIWNWIKSGIHQMNAHAPNIFHILAVIAMIIVSFCSINSLPTPSDPTSIKLVLLFSRE